MQLTWHPVSKDVGNVRNKDLSLLQPVELDAKTGKPVDKKNAKSAGLMANWLKKGVKKEDTEEDQKESEKKRDLEKVKQEAEEECEAKEDIKEEREAKKKKTSE